MASETVTSPEHASSHGCCGGGTKEKSVDQERVKPDMKPIAAEKIPAPAKTSGSCCGGDGQS